MSKNNPITVAQFSSLFPGNPAKPFYLIDSINIVNAINISVALSSFRDAVISGSLNGKVSIGSFSGAAAQVIVPPNATTLEEVQIVMSPYYNLARVVSFFANEFDNYTTIAAIHPRVGLQRQIIENQATNLQRSGGFKARFEFELEVIMYEEMSSELQGLRALYDLYKQPRYRSEVLTVVENRDKRFEHWESIKSIFEDSTLTYDQQNSKALASLDVQARTQGTRLNEYFLDAQREVRARWVALIPNFETEFGIAVDRATRRRDLGTSDSFSDTLFVDGIPSFAYTFDPIANNGTISGLFGVDTVFSADLQLQADGSLLGFSLDGNGAIARIVRLSAADESGVRLIDLTYPDGKVERIAFDENRNFTSKLITGTSNGLPYERTIYADGRIAEALFNATGTRIGTEVTQVIGIDQIVRRLDATGVLQSTITTTPDDVGNVTRTTDLPSGRSVVELLQPANPTDLLGPKVLVSRTELYQEANGTVDVTERYNASNELQSIERRSTVVLDNGDTGQQVVTFDALTRQQVSTVLGGNGAVISTTTTQTLTPADNARLNDLVSGLGGLNGAYSQWIAGNKVEGAILLGGASVNVAIALGGESVRQSLGGVNSLFGGLGQLINLDQVFSRSGNEFGKLSATASALNFANNINRLLESGANGTGAFSAFVITQIELTGGRFFTSNSTRTKPQSRIAV